jgi:L-malate glycosyltransferase
VTDQNCLQQDRITYVIGSLATGGAERQLMELLSRLDREQWQPSLVLFDDLDFARAQQLVSHVFSLGLSRNGASRGYLRGWTAAKTVVKLTRIFRALRPRVVHAVLPASFVLAAPAAKLARVPVLVGSRRCLIDSYRTDALMSSVDRIATRMCDFVLGNSRAVTNELITIDHIPPARTKTIYNGVDTERFGPRSKAERRQFGLSAEHLVFGNIANFLPYKRHVDFVDAAAMISSQLPEARFLLAGEDRGGLAAIKRRVQEQGLQDRILIIPGTREPERLYPLMDVFICASETEGLSNVLLEAAATGLPIIATDVGGNREIVRPGHNGLIVSPRHPEEIASAALQLATNEPLRQLMGRRSRNLVEEEFSLGFMVQEHQNLYLELLRRKAVGAAV